jgi:hypothetical protein
VHRSLLCAKARLLRGRLHAELENFSETRFVEITQGGLTIGLDPFRVPGAERVVDELQEVDVSGCLIDSANRFVKTHNHFSFG